MRRRQRLRFQSCHSSMMLILFLKLSLEKFKSVLMGSERSSKMRMHQRRRNDLQRRRRLQRNLRKRRKQRKRRKRKRDRRKKSRSRKKRKQRRLARRTFRSRMKQCQDLRVLKRRKLRRRRRRQKYPSSLPSPSPSTRDFWKCLCILMIRKVLHASQPQTWKRSKMCSVRLTGCPRSSQGSVLKLNL